MTEAYVPKGAESFMGGTPITPSETPYQPKGAEFFFQDREVSRANEATTYQPKGATFFAKDTQAKEELSLEQMQAIQSALREAGQQMQAFGRLTQYAPNEAERKRLTTPKRWTQQIADVTSMPAKAIGKAYTDSPIYKAIEEIGGKFLYEAAVEGKDVPVSPRMETFLGSAGETLISPLTGGQTPHEVLAGTNVGGERLAGLKEQYPGSASIGSMGGYFLGMALTKGFGLNPITYAATTAALNEKGLQDRMTNLGVPEYALMNDGERTRRIALRAGISAVTLKALGSLGGNSQSASFIDLLKVGAKTTPKAFGIGALSAIASDAVTGDVALTDPEYIKRVIQSGGEMAALSAFMQTGRFASAKSEALFQKATVKWKLGSRITVSPEQVRAVMTGSPTDKPLTPREKAAVVKLFSTKAIDPKEAVKSGLTIDIPAERSVILQDREYWSSIKKLFGQVSKPKVTTEQLGEVQKSRFLLPPAQMPANDPNFVAVASSAPRVAPIALQQAKATGSALIGSDGTPVKKGFYYLPKVDGAAVSIPSAQLDEAGLQNFMLNHYQELSQPGAVLMVSDDGTTTGLGVALGAGSEGKVIPKIIMETPRIYSPEYKTLVDTKPAQEAIKRAETTMPAFEKLLKETAQQKAKGTLTEEQALGKIKSFIIENNKDLPTASTMGTPLSDFEDIDQAAKNLFTGYSVAAQLNKLGKVDSDKTLESYQGRLARMYIGFGKGGIEDMNLLKEQADRLGEIELKDGVPYIADPENARVFFTLYPTLAPKSMPFIVTETGKKIAPAIGKYGVLGDPELQKFIEEQGGLGHVDDKVSLISDKFRITMQVIGNDPLEQSAPNKIYHRIESGLVNRHKKAADMQLKFIGVHQKHGLYGKNGYLNPFDGMALSDLMEGKEPSPFLKLMLGAKKLAKLQAAVPDIRKVFDSLYEEETAYLESIGEEYEPRIENYVPRIQKMSLLREQVSETAGLSAILEETKASKEVKDRHIQRRKLREPRNPERNLYKLELAYAEEVADSIYLRPIIAELDVLRQQFDYAGAQRGALAVDKYTKENLLRQTTALDKALHLGKGTRQRAIIDAYIQARGMKALSFNPAWSLQTQWNSLDLLSSQVGTKNLILGALSWASKNTKNLFAETNTNYMKERGRLIEGLAGDADSLATKIYFTPIDTAKQVAGVIANTLEYNLNGISFSGGLLQAKELGLTGEDAFRFADVVAQTQSMYNVEDRFYILNSASFRALKGFMTYTFDRYNIAKRLVGRGGGAPYQPTLTDKTRPKTPAEREAYAKAEAARQRRQVGAGINLIVYSAIVNALRMFVFGLAAHGIAGSTIPVFGEYIDQSLASLLSHLGLSSEGKVGAALLGLDKAATRGKATTTIESDWANLNYALRDWIELGDTKGLESEIMAWTASFAGIPGGIQMQRTIKGYADAERGFVADRTGKPLYSLEGIDKVIAVALGTSMTPAAIKSRKETISSIELESFADKYKKVKAKEQQALYKKYAQIIKMKPEERVVELKSMAETDRADVESLIKIREAHLKGDEMTPKERKLAQLLIKDGSRAFAVYHFYIKGRTKAEIKTDMERLKKVGLLTDELQKQLVQVIKQDRSPKQ